MASKVLRIRCSRAWTSTLHRHPVGDQVLVDEGPQDLVLCLGGGGKAHLDLRKADLAQGLEEFQLLLQVHGVYQAWLPSRRSTLHQTGAWVMVLSGQVRSGRGDGGEGFVFPAALSHGDAPFQGI